MLTNEAIDKGLYKAFTEARKGKQKTADEYKFEMNLTDNLLQLREDIVRRTYKPSRGTAFISHNPVDREIFAAPFRDRVIHHFICDYIMDWWDRRLIPASYSCRKGLGTDAGVRDLYAKMRKVSHNFQDRTVAIKIDLSSYFCSIPRKGLYERVKWGLQKQFLHPGHTVEERDIYRMLDFLCREIIFDDPTVGVYRKGSAEEWAKYPKRKSLFYQRPGVGIVIGNLTSQMFSNIYLDQLDRFVTITLGEKAYGRYVDDAFFIIPESRRDEFFNVQMPKIESFISGLQLILNPKKTFCQDIKKGVPFLGTIAYPYHVLPGKRFVRNFRTTARLVQSGEKDMECLISYIGRLQHMDSGNLLEKTFSTYGIEYRRSKKCSPNSLYYTNPKVYEKRKCAQSD